MIKRLFLISFFLTCSAAQAPAWAAATAPLYVLVDHGVPLALSSPANSVFIANPDIADVQVMSPTSIMIFGKRVGETTFMATDANGNTLAQYTVDVTQDLGPLRQELTTSMPGSSIKVESVPNGIVLTGEAKDAAAIADAYKIAMRYIPAGGDIINRVKVSGSNQVMIRVRFAEVERNIDNELGFNWQNFANVGGFMLGSATGNPVAAAGSGAFNENSETGLYPRPNNTTLSLPNDVLGVSHQGKHFNINAMIDALSQDGLVTILAEPNLTAMSGETAYFLAGGEFPIPIPQGLGQISIQFKDYGISLEFTPTIINDNRISLHVKPEVSQLSTTGAITLDSIAIPGLLTRKAETTVEIASGESFAIAGLMDNSQAQTINEFPILGDMPVLGALFRDSQFQNGQTELIIVITPYVVKPSNEQLALPTDGMSPPSEVERLIGLRTNSSDPTTRVQSGTPVGVKVDPAATLPIPPVPSSELGPVDADVPPSMPTMPPASSPSSPTVIPTSPKPLPSVAPPAHDNPTNLTPAGPGGFILE